MAQDSVPAVRITGQINESQLVTLKGNTHPLANSKNDRGRVSSDLPMTDLVLVLSRDAAQQAAFEKFVASQYDATSPNFHQWLQPEEIGAKFGPSQTDIATISNWLTGHGFSVDEVSKDRMTIRFSGTAGQVENAFHTEIHNLEVKGVQHIGNMSDPQIPAAMAPVVMGVKALHNFFPRPLHRMGSKVMRDSTTGKWKRVASAAGTTRSVRALFETTDQYGDLIEDVGPYDFATIYNVLPLWNSTTPIDGTGQTIAIAGTSDINPADVAAFRADFGLPTNLPANIPQQIKGANGLDPGECTTTAATATCTIDDLIENSLDVEWSGSIAKNAQIILVTSGSKSATDDTVYDSASYVVSNKTAPILNVSYGECEWFEGTAGNVSYYNLWQSAASEGIAVFVAAGDSDSASCDDGMDTSLPYAAEYGLSVSGLASTPYNTAVGGTDLYWCPITDSSCTSPAAQYWNTSNSATTLANAKGYVPEVPWNDTCAGTFGFQETQEIASGIGVSGVNDAELGCNFAANLNYEREAYYYYGADYLSPLVDIVGGSGGASGCVVSNTTTGVCATGSTTTGTGNSSIALYNNGWVKPSWQTGVPGIPSDGVRDIPDVSFFASDGFLGSAYLICVSEGGYSCTYSNKSEPFAQEVGGTSVATPAMAGVMALINQKFGAAQGLPNMELYTLAAKQAASPGYSACSAESVTTSSSCYFNDIDAGSFTPSYNNAVPCDYGAFGYLSPNCAVVHSGDGVGIIDPSAGTPGYNAGTGYDLATGLGSLNVANVVNNWTSTIGTGTTTVTVTPGSTSIAVNQSLTVAVTVAAIKSGGTTPTGSVTLSSGSYTSSAEQLSSGAYSFTIPADSLANGTDTLSVSYSGDSNYAPSSGSASVMVTKLTASVSATPSATSINSNQTLVVTGTVTGSGVTPTGTVFVSYGTTYTSAAATLNGGSYSVTITPNSLPGGTDILSVQYSGDANYNAATGSTSVNVTYVAVLNPTVTVTSSSTTVDSGSPLTVTVTVTGPTATPANPTPTGTVTLTGSGYALTTVTLSNGVAQFTIPANTLASSPTTTVTDTLTANYQGDPDYNQAIGSVTLTVTQSGYSLSATTPAAISAGSSATTTVSVSSPNDYTGTLTFTSGSCVLTSSPSGAVSLPTCALTGTGTVTMTDGTSSGTVTYTVNTTGATTAALDLPKMSGESQLLLASAKKPATPAHRTKGSGWFGAAGGTALAALLLFLVPGGSRKWRKMLSMLLLMAAVTFAGVGCGGGGSGSTTNTQGIPTVTVTATPSSVTLGSSSNVSIQISVTGSDGTPTGSVSFSGGGYTSTSQALTSGGYTYSLPASDFTTVGSDVLTVSYSGDTNYYSGTGTTTLTVNNVPTTAGNYTFTVTPTSSVSSTATPPSTTFTVTVN
jgi:subtilase family serine protease